MDRHEPAGEDCLVLNVWTNSLESSGKRPVMVWLHGGGYSGASGSFIMYDGTNLAHKHDVVVVTLNHRLNVFGFTYLGALGGEKYADSGNVGMRDIVMALARTGNPSHKQLPNWPTFNTSERATMILNDDCKAVNDPHGEERRALAALRTRT